jgi:ferrous iron transport protein B
MPTQQNAVPNSGGYQRPQRVVLVGNPNSGKTTIFNALTGLNYKVGNYPGVTVEKKEGRIELDDGLPCIISDLPGIYTLSGESLDEQVAATALQHLPDAIIAIVDASNLERNLYIVSELIDLGAPILLVLNMSDVAEERGTNIRSATLSRLLDVPVIRVCGTKKVGIDQLKVELSSLLQATTKSETSSTKQFAWASGDKELVDLSLERNRLATPADYGAVASARYKWINSIVQQSVTQSQSYSKRTAEKIDAIATHRIFGLIVFAIVMAVIFQSIFSWASAPMDLIDGLIGSIGDFVTANMPPGQLRSLIVDGVLAGVGSVIIFIPQIALLFFFIGILEDSGYLCRAAFVMDRLMRKFGLQGRSFIPLLSSFACAVPGIMATRSISSLADRFITILVAPLMSCSARLPVYALLIAAFIPNTYVGGIFSVQGLVMLALYALGIVFAAIVALILKLTLFRGSPALFVMEMPPFRRPSLTLVLREVWDRVMIFVKTAGTIIFACSIVLWFLASYPQIDGQAAAVEHSYAGQVGKAMEPLIEPLGFDWKIGIGLLASFAAREVFVSTLATVYNLESDEEGAQSLTLLLQNGAEQGSGIDLPAALSLLVFYVFACQCMSTLAVCRRETGSWRWPALMFVYMTLLAYGGAFTTYRLAQAFL